MTHLNIVPAEPSADELQTKALTVAEQAKALRVADAAGFAKAGDTLKVIKGMAAEIVDFFAPLKKKAHEAHKALTAAETKQLAPLAEAERTLKAAMVTYQAEEDRKRRAEELRLQEEARRRAEDDALLEAIALEESGEKEAAEAIIAAPVVAPVVMLRPAARVEGVTFRETWRAEVTDALTLVRAVAEGKAPLACITVNTSFLDGQARALKGAFAIPGARAIAEKVVSAARA